MIRPPLIALAVAVSALVAGLSGPPASAAPAAGPPAPAVSVVATGHDVSYPQCGQPLPIRGDVAVVGVNAGTGTTTNPCLAEQLAWGDADGRLADVYVNTANPGHIGGWWPGSDLLRSGLPVDDPRGRCVGAEDAACAYVYGYSIAVDDLARGVPLASERIWWLDVETMNTWSWNRSANLAVLEGMTAALRAAGAEVGVYSTSRQWSIIVGGATASSSLAGTPAWIAGATSREGAAANCAAAPFAAGGRVILSQWVEDGQDHDTACAPAVVGTRPVVQGPAVAGSTLTVAPGRWGPAEVALRFQWLRDGLSVEGATGTSLLLSAADVGASITVQVVAGGSGPGGAAPRLALTSDPTAVVAAAPVVDPAPSASPRPTAPSVPTTPPATPATPGPSWFATLGV